MLYSYWIVVLVLAQKVYSQCSGSPLLTTVGYTKITVTSPNYDNGYPKDLNCVWRISTSIPGSSLLVQINSTVNCGDDDVNIYHVYDGTDNTAPVIFSCSDPSPKYIVASSGTLYTVFRSDSTTTSGEKGFAFNVISANDLSYNACPTLKTLVASTSSNCITSPGFPDEYPSTRDCRWRIEKTSSTSILELNFKFVDIEFDADGPCGFDYVTITDDGTGVTVLKTCGEDQWTLSKTYTTTSNVTVRFVSDATENGRGFILEYLVQSTSSPDDSSACFFDNCVVLPVLLAVGGIVLIAIIAVVIIFIVSKHYAKKNVISQDPKPKLQKKRSFKALLFPTFGSKSHVLKRLNSTLRNSASGTLISSKPPRGHRHVVGKQDVVHLERERRTQKPPQIPPALLKKERLILTNQKSPREIEKIVRKQQPPKLNPKTEENQSKKVLHNNGSLNIGSASSNQSKHVIQEKINPSSDKKLQLEILSPATNFKMKHLIMKDSNVPTSKTTKRESKEVRHWKI